MPIKVPRKTYCYESKTDYLVKCNEVNPPHTSIIAQVRHSVNTYTSLIKPINKTCYNIIMNRQTAIVWASVIGIITNVVLVGFKMLVGLISGSIAIILDAVNNLTDVLSSVVTIIGTKLAARQPDEGHPYGHGRIEYLTTLLVGVIILTAGIMAMVESIPKILHPELADYSWNTIVVVVAAIVVKLILGLYVRHAGRRFSSSSLIASGIDALFDAVLSFGTLVGIIVTLVFHVSIDGILGAIISLFIIKTSLEILFEASNEILGQAADRELTSKLKSLICTYPEVSGAYDLILHNYGPTELIGSVRIQIPDNLTAKEIHRLTREISHRIYTKYSVSLTIGIYADNSTKPAHREIREFVMNLVNRYPEIHQVHGLYIDDETKLITFDLVLPAHYSRKPSLKQQLSREIRKTFPGYKCLIEIDIDLG